MAHPLYEAYFLRADIKFEAENYNLFRHNFYKQIANGVTKKNTGPVRIFWTFQFASLSENNKNH